MASLNKHHDVHKGPDSHHIETDALEKATKAIKSEDIGNDDIDEKAERKLVLKQDILILPLLALSIMFGYWDRGNIGNARVLGMQEDLGLSEQQFLNCVMMFYVGYMLVELPAGLLLRYCHPRYVFAAALISFGVFATLLSISNYAGIMVLRVLIGLGEAFVNNAYIYISLWYKPIELSVRTAAIYSMTPVAGAVSGLLAYGVGKNMDGTHETPAWKWLFIIEGSATIGFGLIVLLLLPGLPETVAEKGTFLFRHEDERQLILKRLRASQNTSHVGVRPHQILLALKDPKFYLGAGLIATQGIGIGAFGVFLPTFVHQFGYGRLQTQLISMIPYAFGLLGLIVFSYLSDRMGQKGIIILISLAISCTGFSILLSTTNKVALLAGASFVACGAYPGLVVGVAWNMTFHGGYTKRATAVWGIQVLVQSYSIIATQVYRSPPRFFLGHGISLGLYTVGALCTVSLLVIVKKANASREARKLDFEQRGEVDPQAELSFEDLGDAHPLWRYAV